MRRRVPEALLKMSLGGRDDFSIGQGDWPLVISFSSPRFPSSFPTLRSVFACVAVRSVYGLLIFPLPPREIASRLPRATLFAAFPRYFPTHRDLSLACVGHRKAKSTNLGGTEGENTGSHTCVYVFPCYFLRYVFRRCCCCFMYSGMLHRCSYEFMKKIPFGFMYV